MKENVFWLGFSNCYGVGPVRFQVLLSTFGSAKNAWHSSKSDLQEAIGEKTGEDVYEFCKTFSLEEYLEKMEKKHVSFLALIDDDYPKLLKQIPNPPFVLYVKGKLPFYPHPAPLGALPPSREKENLIIPSPEGEGQGEGEPIIAIVGTRKTTSYGRDITEMFTRDLVHAGYTIVSGLAVGVDSIAHKTTIDSHGKTIAVLGCGVDCCSPTENTWLYDSIIEHGGAIVSELPLGHGPTKGTFPARNRIIAGLSQGIVVTEGTEDSGSLITAEFALKFGRKVFAVPGPITSSMSKGPYKLIEKGAELVTSGEDVIREFQMSNVQYPSSNRKEIKGDTEEENVILELLGHEPLTFDELVRKTEMDSSQVGTLLTMMEVKGYIKSSEGGVFDIGR